MEIKIFSCLYSTQENHEFKDARLSDLDVI